MSGNRTENSGRQVQATATAAGDRTAESAPLARPQNLRPRSEPRGRRTKHAGAASHVQAHWPLERRGGYATLRKCPCSSIRGPRGLCNSRTQCATGFSSAAYIRYPVRLTLNFRTYRPCLGLRGYFPDSRLDSPSLPYFPDQAIGHGATEWSVGLTWPSWITSAVCCRRSRHANISGRRSQGNNPPCSRGSRRPRTRPAAGERVPKPQGSMTRGTDEPPETKNHSRRAVHRRARYQPCAKHRTGIWDTGLGRNVCRHVQGCTRSRSLMGRLPSGCP